MTENATPEPQYAHVIVPDPIQPHADANQDPEDLLRDLVRYHAARAQGFLIGAQTGTTQSLRLMLNEYHIASLYDMMRSQILNPSGRVAFTAMDLNVTMRAYPESIAVGIHSLCEIYGVDPASIKAYRA